MSRAMFHAKKLFFFKEKPTDFDEKRAKFVDFSVFSRMESDEEQPIPCRSIHRATVTAALASRDDTYKEALKLEAEEFGEAPIAIQTTSI